MSMFSQGSFRPLNEPPRHFIRPHDPHDSPFMDDESDTSSRRTSTDLAHHHHQQQQHQKEETPFYVKPDQVGALIRRLSSDSLDTKEDEVSFGSSFPQLPAPSSSSSSSASSAGPARVLLSASCPLLIPSRSVSRAARRRFARRQPSPRRIRCAAHTRLAKHLALHSQAPPGHSLVPITHWLSCVWPASQPWLARLLPSKASGGVEGLELSPIATPVDRPSSTSPDTHLHPFPDIAVIRWFGPCVRVLFLFSVFSVASLPRGYMLPWDAQLPSSCFPVSAPFLVTASPCRSWQLLHSPPYNDNR